MLSRRTFLRSCSAVCASVSVGGTTRAGLEYDKIIDVYDPNKLNFKDALAQNVGAIIYQTSQGLCYIDRNYREYRTKAIEHNILWGAYHVLSQESNASQLDRFLSIEDGKSDKIAMAVDWERACGSLMPYHQLRDFIAMFVDRLHFYPIIYGGDTIRATRELIDGDYLLAKCPLWYLRIRDTPVGLPTKTWAAYTLWQYDDEHRRNGAPPAKILPGADWSRFSGSLEDLRRKWPFRRPG